MKKPTTVDEYISAFPEDVQGILAKVRTAVRKAAPGAEETIGYGMPTYKLNGKNLVHFAAFKNHIGFYPTPTGIEAFKRELAKYEGAKGSVQFPLDERVPLGLIARIVEFRAGENEEKFGSGLPKTSAPAARALAGAGVRTLKDLAKRTEKEILGLHGVGPSAMPRLRAALKAKGLSFRKP